MSPGVRGELWVRGYSVMQGYWGDENKTKELITPDKWVRTGDMAEIAENGQIYIRIPNNNNNNNYYYYYYIVCIMHILIICNYSSMRRCKYSWSCRIL